MGLTSEEICNHLLNHGYPDRTAHKYNFAYIARLYAGVFKRLAAGLERPLYLIFNKLLEL